MFLILLLTPLVSASDVLVWQGQYYTDTTFNQGTYEFNFTVYDSPTGGNICYSNVTSLTTGKWGEWKTEQAGVSSSCNNVSKDYFLNININGVNQPPRRRLIVWHSLRKNVDEITTGKLQTAAEVVAPIVNASLVIAPVVNATEVVAENLTIINYGFFNYLGSMLNRITKLFIKDIDFAGDINGTGNITSIGKIQGNYYSLNGLQGITNTTGYSVCKKIQGMACVEWCTFQINNGIITGCI